MSNAKKELEKLLQGKAKVKCSICKSTDANHNTGSNLLVDHCHSSMQIRGLLCHNCNSTLGLLKDNVIVLESMITHLKK
jgi:LSD1 subclass zinc finger protein